MVMAMAKTRYYDGDGDINPHLAIVSNSMPENPKAESPSTHNTLAPGSYFLIIVFW